MGLVLYDTAGDQFILSYKMYCPPNSAFITDGRSFKTYSVLPFFPVPIFEQPDDRIPGNTRLDGCFPETFKLDIQPDNFGTFLFIYHI